MDNTCALEIYRQRYETYRHLDRLRWYIFQIPVVTGSLAVALAESVAEKSIMAMPQSA